MLQLEGAKRWRLHRCPKGPLPRSSGAFRLGFREGLSFRVHCFGAWGSGFWGVAWGFGRLYSFVRVQGFGFRGLGFSKLRERV